MSAERLDGYETGVEYVEHWQPELAPPWLDAVVVEGGLAPPRADASSAFRYLDLGCGRGTSVNLLAASCPQGEFVGVDVMRVHIDAATALAAEAGLANASFVAASFESLLADPPAPFDYVVMHGVWTWVDERNRALLVRLLDRVLRPGGVLYVSYNTLPGWTMALPAQRLLLALASGSGEADPVARLHHAAATIRALDDAGALAVTANPGARWLLDEIARREPGYVVHEYLHAGWRPIYVTELLDALAPLDVALAGSASFLEGRREYVLRRAQRALVDAADATPERELLLDFCLNRSLRRDVFVRAPRTALGAAEVGRWLLAQNVLARVPAEAVAFELAVPAGRLRFDNRATREVVAHLAAAPGSLGVLARNDPADGPTAADVLAARRVLLAAEVVLPADPAHARSRHRVLNRAILRRCDGARPIPMLATAHGVPLDVTVADQRSLRGGGEDDGTRPSGARPYQAIHAALDLL
ncbi:MAG: methyltransferase regulatory domain-containing protein [Ectothiorhodospiraceae bacterium]|nr:methyltransferase regulatory domain-containing protein [Ectothiorhodospiraceae bacterium]